MTYVAPSTVVAGQTYSAANHNIIVNDLIDHEDRLDTVQNAQYPARNVLVNGAMQFAQRATSATGISGTGDLATYATADRWGYAYNNVGSYTQAITADVPTGQGFRNALRMTCTTALTSLSATSYGVIRQRLEGQTLQHIKKGTANAQQLTIQFWVKGSTTGTYICELQDQDNTRQVASSYTINAANTWEQKTITFPADTTGAFDNDNAASLDVKFWIAAGTNYTSGSLATTWAARTEATSANGQTNLSAAVNNYIQITGVQLEPGSVASPFEFVRYDDELRRCQRYFYKISDFDTGWGFPGFVDSTSTAVFATGFPTTMRTAPTATSSGTFEVRRSGVTSTSVSSMTFDESVNGCRVNATASVANLTAGQGVLLANFSGSPTMQFSAEL